MNAKPFAVLTRDIVASSKIKGDDLLQIQNCLKRQLGWFHPEWLAGGPSFFRGDGWQLAVNQGNYALRIALFSLCVFRANAAASRIAIGIGTVETLVPENISISQGEAFTLSGHLLDQMEAIKVASRRPTLDLAVTPEDPYRSFAYRTAGAIVNSWKPQQARLGLEILQGKNHDSIARDTGISRNSISRSLTRMAWPHIEELLILEESSAPTM